MESDVISGSTGFNFNVTDSETYETFILGTAVAYDVDMSFKICLGINPESSVDFIHHVGSFSFGPEPQHNNCSVGRECIVGPFRHVSSNDRLLFVPALPVFENGENGENGLPFCGRMHQMDIIACNASFASPTLPRSLSTDFNITLGTAELLGGCWRLCFCLDATKRSCDKASDFETHGGFLQILGPNSFHQDQMCFAGHGCVVEITGQGLSASDIVLATASDCNGLSGFIHLNGLNAAIAMSVQNGTVLTVGLPTLPLGIWTMCYCAEADCTSKDFIEAIRVGDLVIKGPYPEQHMECQVAQACVRNFTGTWLSLGDHVAAVSLQDHCGALPSALVSHGKPKAVSLNSFNLECLEAHHRNCLVDLVFTGSEGGQGQIDLPFSGTWRLCYCSSHEGCFRPSSFALDVGLLTVHGVRQTIDRTCVLGESCSIHMRKSLGGNLNVINVNLDSDDTCERLMMTGSAGLGQYESYELFEPYESLNDEMLLSPSMPGKYKLCWCPNDADARICANFVDMGTVHFVGSRRLSSHSTAISYQTCVSGEVCSLVGVPGLLTNNFLISQNTCGYNGDAGQGDKFASFFLPAPGLLLTVAGGEYLLCWCSVIGGWCDNVTDSDYSDYIAIGSILIQGPSPLSQDKTCVAGQECSVEVSRSVGLSLMEKLFVQETCGTTNTPLGWPNSGRTLVSESGVSDSSSLSGTFATFATATATFTWGDVRVSSAGGFYRLCWCGAASGSGGCRNGEDFRVDLGGLTLIGPRPNATTQTCTSGQRCEIHGLTGVHLSDQDDFMVLSTCGHHRAVSRLSNVEVSVGNGGATLRWDSISSAGGLYHLCWCSGATSSTSCGGSPDFRAVAGQLHILGPEPLEQDKTCLSGQRCLFSVSRFGVGLGVDSVAVLETCGVTKKLKPDLHKELHESQVFSLQLVESLTSDSRDSHFVMPLSFPGGIYRLCWCGSTTQNCRTADDFRTDLGALHLVGPQNRRQMTCVSGEICKIDVFGTYLSQDVYAVQDTCGVQIVPHFPEYGTSSEARGAVAWGTIPAAGGNLAKYYAASLIFSVLL